MSGDTPAFRFRRTASRYPTGVTVVSTLAAGDPHAMTVNSFVTVSLEPLLVLVSLSLTCRTYERIRTSGVFAVTVLAAHQQELANWFASSRRGSGPGAFTGIDWRPAPCTAAPLLVGGVSYFDCLVVDIRTVGDHALVIGSVQDFGALSDEPPLMFVDSRYAAISGLEVSGSPIPGAPSLDGGSRTGR